jgi:alkanesulfonate monooxygenase SsuD/methylene tetrahydromethanopterin reductase-like flavin-dependent oxidoreductase (luciferase family)
MDFGIVFPSYIRAWEDAKRAEDHGFTHAWFYDSQMLYSDIYATMALAAEHTSRIKLGTLVAIPGNRIAPVTAHSIATINELAPGRVILGVGTGFTGRNVMGMPPIPLKTVREHIEVIRPLLEGKEALYREGNRERWIRMLHPGMNYVNLEDRIPIHMASNAPKALKMVGEVADGWITISLDEEIIKDGVSQVMSSAKAAGRKLDPLYTTLLTAGCVLRPGESITSKRVLNHIGPFAILQLHTRWEPGELKIGPFAHPSVAELARRYFEEHIVTMKAPADRRYQDMHFGHLIFLQPGEEKYLTPDLIRLSTLTGPPAEVIERIKGLEEAGVTNVGINVAGTDGRELIREFGREVISKY